MSITAQQSAVESQVGVYECEVTLKFRIIEEDRVMQDRERLLELLNRRLPPMAVMSL